jgi:hypothetical protein
MSERREEKERLAKAAGGSAEHSRQRVAYQVGGMCVSRDLVDFGDSGDPCYLGHFRLAGLAKQILVDKVKPASEVSVLSNKTRHSKHRKQGRPRGSSDVRLTPHFRSPVDIERLGKALVAIAMRQAELDKKPDKDKLEGASDDVDE